MASSGTAAAQSDHDHLGQIWEGDPGGAIGFGVRVGPNTNYGFQGKAPERGVFGWADASSGSAEGVFGRADSPGGKGMLGIATASSGKTEGVFGRAVSTDGRGVAGVATSSSGSTRGVFGRADSSKGRGVEGIATADSGPTRGVRGFADSDSGIGVLGIGDTGVFGRSNTGGDAVVAKGDAKVTEFLEVGQAGTRDTTALELAVDGERALRIAPTASREAPNIVGGHPSNSVASGAEGATIAGGGFDSGSIESSNKVFDDYGTVGGGFGNQAGSDDGDATTADNATVGGGDRNTASGRLATVGGGLTNTASGRQAAVGGGSGNTASGEEATVPGGSANTASGSFSFASGEKAKAADNEAFVWNDGTRYHDLNGDGSDDGFSSAKDVAGSGVTGAETFHASARGGFRFVTSSSSVTYISGGSSGWATTSTRAAKTNIDPVDPTQVLEGVTDMEVATWEYKDEDGEGAGERHIGPMAEDFHAAVDVGASDEHINSINADGVALAAIQGLADRLNERADRIEELEQASEQKDERIEELESEAEAAREENAELEATIDDLAARLEAVENQLDPVAAD